MDVTHLLERLEAFEDRLGVRIESLGADLEQQDDGDWSLSVRGELHPQSGTSLEQSLQLVIAVYDSTSKIVATTSSYFHADSFFGFDIFDESLWFGASNIARIRIYPKQN